MPSKHSSGFGMVRALRLRSRGGRAGWFGGVISAGWSSAGRWSAGIEDLQAERVAGRESCRDRELQGELVVLVESLLQVGALLGDGLLEDGLLELKICRQSASPGESEL